MCLSHVKIDKESGTQKASQEPAGALKKKSTSVPYQLAMGRLFMLKKQYQKADEYLTRAMKEDILVRKIPYRTTFGLILLDCSAYICELFLHCVSIMHRNSILH